MKNSPFIVVLLCAAILVNSSCRKEAQKQSGDWPTSATQVIPSNPSCCGVLGTGHFVRDTIRLTANIAWRLECLVYVDSADVLIIDPGTTIRGALSPGAGIPGGGLVICRGGKILAEGTATNPIIFTSAAATPQSGDWCGVMILGNASSNHCGRVQAEGIPANPPANATYGGTIGTDDADNSGIFKYVRIDYAGFELSPNNEINGLTLCGVGSSTVIDYVNVFKARDDAFQFFGGTVNASHLIAAQPLDDMFEMDNGYRGTIRYALGVADTTRADVSLSEGILSSNSSCTGCTGTPVTNPKFKNVTLVGLANPARAVTTNAPPSGIGRYGRAVHLRNNTDFDIDSSIFMGYNFGISLDTCCGTTPAKYRANYLTWLTKTYTHAFFSGGTPIGISCYIVETCSGNPVTGAGFAITSPGSFYNWAIAAGNMAYVTTNPNQSIQLANLSDRCTITSFIPIVLSPARQAGAFPNGLNWATGTWWRLC